ncbi:MAG TPA: hypothetical protein VF532_23135 [Candidatus Angelobacter sp.]
MAGNTNNAKVWREAVSASNDCPSIEVLEKVMEGSSPDPQSEAHVAECPHCQSEITMLRKFEYSVPSADEGAAVAWIAAQLERNQQKAPQPAKAAVVPFWRAMFRVPYMAAAAALIAAIALGISMYVSEDNKPSLGGNVGIGGYRSGEIRITTPSGDLSQAPEQLTWEPISGATSYTVAITGVDIDHTVVWSGETTQSSLTVTPELKAKMRPGKPLEWTVIAKDATGKELATGKGSFRVALNANK